MANKKYRIDVADQQSHAINHQRIVEAICLILEDHHYQQAQISVALVDDETIHQLNRQYLQHDYPTDVLSFLLDSGDDYLEGEIIVSTDTAQGFACQLQISLEQELLLYIIHGTLHLVGLDDTDSASAVQMRAAEQEYLQKFGMTSTWLENESS